MNTPHDTIDQLSGKAALITLALVLERAGLRPDPFAPEPPEAQLREALHQPDLPPLDLPPRLPPSDGDVARATLHYLAEREPAMREAIGHLIASGPVVPEGERLDPATLAVGAHVLLAFHSEVELRVQPRKGWGFHFKLTPLPHSTIGKVLGML